MDVSWSLVSKVREDLELWSPKPGGGQAISGEEKSINVSGVSASSPGMSSFSLSKGGRNVRSARQKQDKCRIAIFTTQQNLYYSLVFGIFNFMRPSLLSHVNHFLKLPLQFLDPSYLPTGSSFFLISEKFQFFRNVLTHLLAFTMAYC